MTGDTVQDERRAGAPCSTATIGAPTGPPRNTHTPLLRPRPGCLTTQRGSVILSEAWLRSGFADLLSSLAKKIPLS